LRRPHASRAVKSSIPASHARLSTRQGVSAFNQPLSFDTSKVTNMGYMFFQAAAFNQELSFDMSKVTFTYGMFSGSSGRLKPPDSYTFTTKTSLQSAVSAYNFNPTAAIAKYGLIANWVVSAITDMSSLFYNMRIFNADISNWDTSSVTTMARMFGYAYAFNQPLSFDTSKVADMQYMFYEAKAFNQPLSFDTSKVAKMGSMFKNANSLSDANKLLIRCAWASTSAFASAGYGSSWGPGNCA